MIASITTSTVSTVTAMGSAGAMGAFCVLALVSCLVPKHAVIENVSTRSQTMAKYLDVAILPLAITLAVIIVIKSLEILA